MEKWKSSTDVMRFKYALEQAVDKLEYEADMYGYKNEREYLNTINFLKNQIKLLEEQIKDKLW